LIYERGLSAQLREDLRASLTRAAQPVLDELTPMSPEDFEALVPISRKTRTPSMMKVRAYEILAERRKDQEKTS